MGMGSISLGPWTDLGTNALVAKDRSQKSCVCLHYHHVVDFFLSKLLKTFPKVRCVLPACSMKTSTLQSLEWVCAEEVPDKFL